ncbi:hypothetical protein D3C83_179810 [compost metagenome]
MEVFDLFLRRHDLGLQRGHFRRGVGHRFLQLRQLLEDLFLDQQIDRPHAVQFPRVGQRDGLGGDGVSEDAETEHQQRP